MKMLIALLSLSFLCSCSLVKTREVVKEEQKAAAEADQPEPMDNQAIDDSLAEMGVDPNAAVNDANKTPEPESDAAGAKKKKKSKK